MQNVPGADDDVNLELAPLVHKKDIHIHISDNGTIASGGVDFFLAGQTRTIGNGSRIGVHSWDGEDGKEATDFPVGHQYHLPYIDYYVTIGMTRKQAEDFYYFTINSAPAKSIHWMTDTEISHYNLITNPITNTPDTEDIVDDSNPNTSDLEGDIINTLSDQSIPSTSPSAQAITDDLYSKTWVWVEIYYNNDVTIKPHPGNQGAFTLDFKKDGSLSIGTDCNNMSATFELSSNQLVFGPIATTLMYCESSQEHEFAEYLDDVQSYYITDDNELALMFPYDTGAMVFK